MKAESGAHGWKSVLFLTALVLRGVKKRKQDESRFGAWLLSTAAVASFFVRIGGVAYNEIASCSSISCMYLSGAYPLVLIFVGGSIAALIQWLVDSRGGA